MSQFASQLAQADAEYAATHVEGPKENLKGTPYKPFAEGRINATITAARVQQAPWSGDTALYLYVEFESGGKTANKLIKLTEYTGKQLEYSKKQLLSIGWTGSLSDLEEHTHELIGRIIEVNVKNDEYKGVEKQEYHFQRVVSSPVAATTSEEDYPF